MAVVPHREITAARLKSWSEKLAMHAATPILLVGVGHDSHLGDIVICAPEEESITTQLLVGILRKAIATLQRPTG